MSSFKNNKVAGPDGLIGEFLKQSFLSKGSLFDHSLFPTTWSED